MLDQVAKKRMRFRLAVFTAFVISPIMCVAVMWFSAPPWEANWWESFAVAHAVMAFLMYAGNWAWAGTPLRWAFPIALIAATYHSAGTRGALLSAGSLLVLYGIPRIRLRMTAPTAEAVPLALPFSDGLYYAGQGGQTKLLNHHNGLKSQKYAVDFLRLNGARMRCRGFYPKELERYSIYGATVASPCDGEVTVAIDGHPDFPPPHSDPRHASVNYILIRHASLPDTYVLLAHLKQGSVAVKVGDRVQTGQAVGQVGNSGNSTEPHLHIQIKKGGLPGVWSDGEGAPMIFGGNFLVRGDLARATQPAQSA